MSALKGFTEPCYVMKGELRLTSDRAHASASVTECEPGGGHVVKLVVRSTVTECQRCGREIEQKPRGRRRRYCSEACRQSAYRLRITERPALGRFACRFCGRRDVDTTWGSLTRPTCLDCHLTWGRR
jgi:hypothetical protein